MENGEPAATPTAAAAAAASAAGPSPKDRTDATTTRSAVKDPAAMVEVKPPVKISPRVKKESPKAAALSAEKAAKEMAEKAAKESPKEAAPPKKLSPRQKAMEQKKQTPSPKPSASKVKKESPPSAKADKSPAAAAEGNGDDKSPVQTDDDDFAKPAPRSQKDRDRKESDAELVQGVRAFMKQNKLSQVTVGQEARISQAVISQWLSLKYHGHNDKVRAARPPAIACALFATVLCVPPCAKACCAFSRARRWTRRCGIG